MLYNNKFSVSASNGLSAWNPICGAADKPCINGANDIEPPEIVKKLQISWEKNVQFGLCGVWGYSDKNYVIGSTITTAFEKKDSKSYNEVMYTTNGTFLGSIDQLSSPYTIKKSTCVFQAGNFEYEKNISTVVLYAEKNVNF